MNESVSVAQLNQLLKNRPKLVHGTYFVNYATAIDKYLKDFEEKFGLFQKQLQELLKDFPEPIPFEDAVAKESAEYICLGSDLQEWRMKLEKFSGATK